MRVKLAGGTNTEQEFAQYLLDIGGGKLPVNRDIDHIKVRIPDDLVAISHARWMICASLSLKTLTCIIRTQPGYVLEPSSAQQIREWTKSMT